MNIHISVSTEERRATNGKIAYANGNLPKPDKGLKWGRVSSVQGGPSFKALNSPHFDPANAPPDARLVRFADLDDGQCQWGFSRCGESLFCGCPVSGSGSRLFGRYCDHHAALARYPEGGA